MLYTEINLPKHKYLRTQQCAYQSFSFLLASLHHCNMLTEFKTKNLT